MTSEDRSKRGEWKGRDGEKKERGNEEKLETKGRCGGWVEGEKEGEGERTAAWRGWKQKGRGGGECEKPGGEGLAQSKSPILRAKRH